MSKSDADLIAKLEAMPLELARAAIHNRTLGHDFDSPNQALCLSWLAGKDSSLRSAREASTARWARHAAYAAYAAAAIAAISIAITIFHSK